MAQGDIVGSILGTAVADSLGLPYEALSPGRAARLLGPPDRHRFFFGRGMVSDDTEHTSIVVQSLIASGADVELFSAEMARRLRYWLLGLPAGVGFATLRAILKLWMGFGPTRSGVFSAGNGPAMRSAILGAAIDDLGTLRDLVAASAKVTHTDPKAELGAMAVALAAQMATQPDDDSLPRLYLERLESVLGGEGDELLSLVRVAAASVEQGETTRAFAESMGLKKGVSGYVYHTVPVAIHAWLRHPRDFRLAVTDVIGCGGDADTTAAIVGGIVGSGVGRDGIPAEWLDRLWEWPRSVEWLERLGDQLATLETGQIQKPSEIGIYRIFPRNLFFTAVVLGHGFRRLLPPY